MRNFFLVEAVDCTWLSDVSGSKTAFFLRYSSVGPFRFLVE